jgi:hypothetical protein
MRPWLVVAAALVFACSVTPRNVGVCVPGGSFSCVGADGCQGEQTCQPDGRGFGSCRCGTTSGTTGGMVPSCPAGCGTASSCIGGLCVCFEGGYAQCGTNDAGQPNCLDVTSDNENCGGCGVSCPSPGFVTSCVNGSCVCIAQLCWIPDGGFGCSDTAYDSTNCGGCAFALPPSGVSCGYGEVCNNSQCVCAKGFTACAPLAGSDAGYCAETSTDDKNCGGCGSCVCTMKHAYPPGYSNRGVASATSGRKEEPT